MFERFSERARQVVVVAQDEARGLGHGYIGTEHLLLGLLHDQEGVAARVLASLDVTAEEARAQVERRVGRGDEPSPAQIPFTPGAKKALELALREALHLGHDYIGPEHVLLGLVRVHDGVAAQILLDFDADPETIRGETVRLLGGPERGLAAPAESLGPGRSWARPGEGSGRELRRVARPTDVGRQIPFALLVGWALFAVAFGLGLLAGWLVWG